MDFSRRDNPAPDDLMQVLPMRGPAGEGSRSKPGGLLQRLSARGISKNVVKAAVAIAIAVLAIAIIRWAPVFGNAGLVIEPANDSPGHESPAGGEGSGGAGSGGMAGGGAEGNDEAASGGSPNDAAAHEVFVHVVGAVANPGVYSMTEGARVADAVAMAGGLSPDACASAVNLAREVADGEQVYVPTVAEVEQGTAPPTASSGFPATPGSGSDSLININSATAEQLESLPGIGPSTSASIVAYREENGPFASKEDIQNVSGIGAGKYAKIESLICV